MEYEYKVVRTYFGTVADKEEDDLSSAFKRGYEFVNASQPVYISDGCWCIEYVVRRPV